LAFPYPLSRVEPIFRTFFPGKIPRKISRKIFPQKYWEKIEFSAEKVLKIVNQRNSAESDFPRKKMYEKSAQPSTMDREMPITGAPVGTYGVFIQSDTLMKIVSNDI
jgi:hypothetical protein